jgi:ABC-type dipeptide transport system, periplasmic component
MGRREFITLLRSAVSLLVTAFLLVAGRFGDRATNDREDNLVKQYLSCLAAGSLLLALSAGHPTWAQKRGGILRLASPAARPTCRSTSRSTIFAEMPMMGVFNNLIVFDQHKPQVSLDTIVPDLATSWSWNDDDTALTFQLRQDVKWHDGKPFTAADVKCTWDLLLDKRPTSCGSTRARLDMRTNRRNDER